MLDRKMFRNLIVATTWTALSVAAQAQFTGIYTFNPNYDGCCAYYGDLLAQDTNGNLAGTMPAGAWAAPFGSWFNYSPGTAAPVIHELQSSTQAEYPYSGFTLGIDGNLYGAGTHIGGSSYGALFMISSGVMTTLYRFPGGSGGSYPYAPPVQAPDGNLYGVTYDSGGTGSIYQYVMATGTLGWIHPLPAGSRAPLVLANDGNLYGTIPYGGFTINGVAPLNNNGGSVFQVTLSGVVTGIYNISAVSSHNNGSGDGAHPWGAVMQAADGYLYGTTNSAGAYAGGTVYKVALDGSGFTVIHNFQADDGTVPTGGLVQGSDGYLYGLTTANGAIRQIYMPGGGPVFKTGGTLFKVDTTGVNFVRMFTFYGNNYNSGQGSGLGPYATPVLHTNGTIYGLSMSGGAGPSGNSFGTYDNGGELFSYGAGLSKFVSVVGQRRARVGNRISIIGQGFLNTTGVTFGGLATASGGNLRIVSDNFMSVIVPLGAKSGPVTVHEVGTNYSTLYNFTIY